MPRKRATEIRGTADAEVQEGPAPPKRRGAPRKPTTAYSQTRARTSSQTRARASAQARATTSVQDEAGTSSQHTASFSPWGRDIVAEDSQHVNADDETSQAVQRDIHHAEVNGQQDDDNRSTPITRSLNQGRRHDWVHSTAISDPRPPIDNASLMDPTSRLMRR